MTLIEAVGSNSEPAAGARRSSFSAANVNRVVNALISSAESRADVHMRWLEAVATRVTAARPDLATALLEVLCAEAKGADHLAGLSIGEVGVCYEALLSELDRDSRKSSGQFFTPDDAAQFMAMRSVVFPEGVWLDPCCGVGNLSWHLASVQSDPAEFVRHRLILIDRDPTALKTAIALIAADFAAADDSAAVRHLATRSVRRDFLSRGRVPEHDFVIANPPYARAEAKSGFKTASSRDLFAYFIERVAETSRGFISVTPASYLSAPKFQPLRDVVKRESRGGDVFVFDNVPDTLFRGYKFGSNNTSKTNFVRAAVTVAAPDASDWRITPILRWQASERARMFAECPSLLAPLRVGPHGEWAKLGPGLSSLWDTLASEPEKIGDLVAPSETEYSLDVGLTPRYFISATHRKLDRGSKATLHFRSAEDRDRAAVVLNSSLPYIWWRALDGGVTLPRRVLMSVPAPEVPEDVRPALVSMLRKSEEENLVTKLNAGRDNENVRHPKTLVDRLNKAVLPENGDMRLLYSNSMFPLDR